MHGAAPLRRREGAQPIHRALPRGAECLSGRRGAIGEDGRFLLNELERAGVDTRHIDVLPGVRTGHAIIQNDAEGDNCILVFGGANHSTGREQIDRVLSCFGPGDLLTLQNEIRELDYLIRAASARGMRIALTPAPMTEAVRELPLEKIDYLFLNELEAGALLDHAVESAPLDAARELRERFGVRNVALTLGAAGSVFSGETGDFVQAAVPAEVVDTTGAGDTFAGFFLAGALQGFDTQHALYFASAAASIAITRSGASVSIPDRDEVLEKLYREA